MYNGTTEELRQVLSELRESLKECEFIIKTQEFHRKEMRIAIRDIEEALNKRGIE